MTPPSSTASRHRLLGLVLAPLPLGFLLAYIGIRGDNFDFDIYRGALLGLLHGGSPYDFTIYQPQYHVSMGFVYPPFASLVMLPLAVIPALAGKAVMAIGTALLMMATLFGVFRLVDARRATVGRKELSPVVWAWVTIPIVFSIPAISNMQLGQVSFAVACLVLVDVLLLPPKWRGTVVGVAAAIKLTPLIMVPYYLLTRQWRAAINACAVFGVAAIVGAIFRWHDSVRYWLERDVISNSLGVPSRWDNWSIYGDLSRLGLTGLPLTLVWAVVSVLLVGFAGWRALQQYRQGQGLEATLIVGLTASLVVTATWPHHLLFVLVACAVLAVRRPLIGVPSLVFLIATIFLPKGLMGFCVSSLMVAFVIFGMPGDLRPTSRDKNAAQLKPVCVGEPS